MLLECLRVFLWFDDDYRVRKFETLRRLGPFRVPCFVSYCLKSELIDPCVLEIFFFFLEALCFGINVGFFVRKI